MYRHTRCYSTSPRRSSLQHPFCNPAFVQHHGQQPYSSKLANKHAQTRFPLGDTKAHLPRYNGLELVSGGQSEPLRGSLKNLDPSGPVAASVVIPLRLQHNLTPLCTCVFWSIILQKDGGNAKILGGGWPYLYESALTCCGFDFLKSIKCTKLEMKNWISSEVANNELFWRPFASSFRFPHNMWQRGW